MEIRNLRGKVIEVPRRDTLHDPVINTTVTLILPMKLLKDVDT